MKRSKRIYLLLGILAAVCAATFAVMSLEERKEQIQNSGEVILRLDADQVQTLSWESGGTALAFHRDESGKWLYDEDGAFPVDAEKIGARLDWFREFGASFIIEDVEDYSQYGLDDPLCTIRLTTAEESHEITLGDYSKMDAQRYVSIGDGNAYLVSTDPYDDFSAAISDIIDNDETPGLSNVTSIQFTGAENYTAVYEADSPNTYCAGDVYFTNGLPLDTARAEDYFGTIEGLSLTNYVTYNATAGELESFGLTDPELTITVDYTTENENGEESADTFILHVSRDPAELAAEETEEEEITAYARVDASPIVYQISGTSYKALMDASYNDLRHQELLPADFDDITQVDITLEGSAYTLTTSNGEEDTNEGTGEPIWYYEGNEIVMDGFQSALVNLIADEFTGETPTQKKEIGLTVYLANENFPQVDIQLYRYDGSHCLAVVDGEPVSLIGRVYVVDLIESVNAIVLN